jgi:anti-sigma28 factor (negative regulator of flagellin synthesis)
MSWRLVTLLATGGLLLAGCGDDEKKAATDPGRPATSSATAPTAGTLDKAEYVRRADALCARFDRLAKPIQDRLVALDRQGRQVYRTQAPPLLRTAASLARGLLSQLREIPLPRTDAQRAQAFYAEGDSGIARVEELAQAVADGDSARVATLAQAIRSGTRRQRALARTIGLRECANGD